MEWQVEECIEEFKHEKTEERAAKLIICMINNKENVYWDDSLKRLRCGAEVHEEEWAPIMEEVTKALGVKNREEYTKVKYKYNLTQF
jgi:hypothetical protein